MLKLSEKNYIERDVSWMLFNRRILGEAQRTDIPLMERMKFLGIYSNNLDEFFRVRVATLNHIVKYADKESKMLRRRCEKTLKTVNTLNSRYAKEFEETVAAVRTELARHNIHLLYLSDLSDEQKAFVRTFYERRMTGVAAPVWLSSAKGVSTTIEDTIYLAVRLQRWRRTRRRRGRTMPSLRCL